MLEGKTNKQTENTFLPIIDSWISPEESDWIINIIRLYIILLCSWNCLASFLLIKEDCLAQHGTTFSKATSLGALCGYLTAVKGSGKPLRKSMHIHSSLVCWCLKKSLGGVLWLCILLLSPSSWWLISCTQIMAVSFAVAPWLKMALEHRGRKSRNSWNAWQVAQPPV